MTITLSVNRKEGIMASTTDLKLILKNQELAVPLVKKYPKQHNMCFIAGRYMAFNFLLIDKGNETEGHYIQLFYDFKQNRDDALKICNAFVLEDTKELFMYLYDNFMVSNYDKDYDLVELVVDEEFPQHFLSPN